MSDQIQGSATTKRTFWTVVLFYMLIAFEFFYMASPFAFYYKGSASLRTFTKNLLNSCHSCLKTSVK